MAQGMFVRLSFELKSRIFSALCEALRAREAGRTSTQ